MQSVSGYSMPCMILKVVVLCRSLMYSEANRRETFTSWPHAGYRWAQPDPMAQAGFYHQVGSVRMSSPSALRSSVIHAYLVYISVYSHMHSQYLHAVNRLICMQSAGWYS